jgi:hypothetical protein
MSKWAILLVRREVLFSQLVLRAMAPHALCLPRALALGVYLSALGLPAEVVVARERAPTHPRYGFHAWTELYGDVVNDRPEVQIGHSVLQRGLRGLRHTDEATRVFARGAFCGRDLLQ